MLSSVQCSYSRSLARLKVSGAHTDAARSDKLADQYSIVSIEVIRLYIDLL